MSEPALPAAALMDRMYRRQRHIYDLTRKFYLLGRDSLIAELAPPPGASVLEIGCGTGRNLILAACRYPEARLYGVDISEAMLATARGEIARRGLTRCIALAQADATRFDPEALFGVARFERVYISYALSMIPPWREALAQAADLIATDGALHIVDFGDGAALPTAFTKMMRAWLAAFDVEPRDALLAEMEQVAAARGLRCCLRPLYRRYAYLAAMSRQAAVSPVIAD